VTRLRRRVDLTEERGVTLVELLVVCATLGIVMTGIVNVFASGARAGSDADGRFQAQQNARLGLERLQYEARCASAASLVGGGAGPSAGVVLTLPAICSHASGTVTWCVSGGVLSRFAGAACSGTGRPYVPAVTSTAPFSLPAAPSGSLPQLQIALTANATGRAGDGFSLGDTITLRNAPRAP
jgi:Tfp pilus assembly protein PilW